MWQLVFRYFFLYLCMAVDIAVRPPSLTLTTNSWFTFIFILLIVVSFFYLLTTKPRLISSYFQKFLVRIFSRIRTWLKCLVCRLRITTALRRNPPSVRLKCRTATRKLKPEIGTRAKENTIPTLFPAKITCDT